MTPDTARPRVLVGVLALIVGVAVYALLAMKLAVDWLPENRLVQLAYYAIAGTLWLWPAARLTRWMQATPGRSRQG